MLQKISLSFGSIHAGAAVIVTDNVGAPAVIYSSDNLASLISRVGQTRTDAVGNLEVYAPIGKLYKVYALDDSGKTLELRPVSNTSVLSPSASTVDGIKATSGTTTVGQVIHDGNGNIYDSNGNPLSIGGVGQNTNLSTSVSATSIQLLSSSGADTSLDGASPTLAGLMVATDKVKLNNLTQYTDALAKDAAAASLLAGTHVGVSFSYNPTTKAFSSTVSTQATNLSVTPTPTKVVLSSSSGNSVDLVTATNTNAGLMAPTDRIKLDGLVGYTSAAAISDASTLFTSSTHDGVTSAYDPVLKRITLTVNRVTNLTNSPSDTALTITSSTGNSTTVQPATQSAAGVMTAVDKLKLDNIIQYTDKKAQDAAASALVAGTHSGISASYDSGNSKINLSVTAAALSTNLSATYTTTAIALASSTGTGVNLNSATQSTAGSLSAADKTKIDILLVPFTGSNVSNPGTAGLVPVPQASSSTLYLSNDGTWKSVSASAYNECLRRVFVTANSVSGTLVMLAVGSQTDLDAVQVTVDATGTSLTLGNVAANLKLRSVMLHVPASFNSTTSFTFYLPDPYASSNTMDNLIFPQFLHYNLANPSIIQAQTGIAVSISNNILSVGKTGLTGGAAAKYQLKM